MALTSMPVISTPICGPIWRIWSIPRPPIFGLAASEHRYRQRRNAGFRVADTRQRHDTTREVLRRFGYIAATIMFVLKSVLKAKSASGLGCGMAFGPRLAAESVFFELAVQSRRSDRWGGCEPS